jgi:hypothetical protein
MLSTVCITLRGGRWPSGFGGEKTGWAWSGDFPSIRGEVASSALTSRGLSATPQVTVCSQQLKGCAVFSFEVYFKRLQRLSWAEGVAQ